MRRWWDEERQEIALKMRKERCTYAEIGARLGCTMWAVKSWFERSRLEEAERKARSWARMERVRERKRRVPVERSHDALPTEDEILRVIEERDCRLACDPRDLTGALMGDPLPGYSELDRRRTG